MFPETGKIFDWSREFSANFSTETSLVVVVHARNVFEPGTLKQLQTFAAGLESLDVVEKCDSLLSLQYPKRRQGSFLTLPLIEDLPDNDAEADALRKEILANPLLRGSFVNATGTATAFYPTLNSALEVPDLQGYAVESLGNYIGSARMQGIDAYFAGGPLISSAIIGHVWHDLFVLGPVSIVVLAGVFFLFFRWRAALLFNFCTSCSSVIATLGFMGWAGIEITAFISVIMLLICIIGCTEDIHLVSEYLYWRRRGLPQERALRSLDQAVFSALLLTSFSTALGFYMTSISKIPALKDFAIACGTGILLNFFFTIFLAPLFLRGEGRRFSRGTAFPALFSSLLRFLVWSATRRPLFSGLAMVALCGAAVWGTFRLKVDSDFMHFFTKRSPVLQSLERLEEDFGGRSSVIVTVDTNKRHGIWDQESITRLARFHDRLADSFDHVTGLTSYLREYLYQTGESPDREKGNVSLESDQIETCRAIFGNRFLGRFLDFDASRTAIWVRSSISGSSEVQAARNTIEHLAADILPKDWEVRILGEPVVTATITDSIMSELFSSLFLLAFTITVILVLYFRSWKQGLLALIPNLLPVLATFGFMGWFGIPMGTGVFAVAMVAFGVAVDDTIHLFVRFSHESKRSQGRTFEQILRSSMKKELFPQVVTSLTLIAGFAILLFSDFKVHQETGLLFIVAIGTALLADLFLTPLVLRGVAVPDQAPRN